VAEYTKRALLVISSGELGTTVSEIDQNLTMFLQYAALWKAIILIDESDVFLEARMTGVSNRLEQNSLVAGLKPHTPPIQIWSNIAADIAYPLAKFSSDS
jgi:hypothetical protein